MADAIVKTGRKRIGGARTTAFMVAKTVFLFALLLLYLAPFILILINSLKTTRGILKYTMDLIDPLGITFENFIRAFEKMHFLRAFGNSLFVTATSVALIVLISSMTSYFFVRFPWRINKIFFACMVAAMIIPFQVLMTPIISIYGNLLGLLDHRTTLIFLHVGFSISMAVFIYHGFIRSSVPIALEEAATLDGCSRVQTFFRVVFPLLKPTTATLVVLNVLAIWNDFLLPSLILGKRKLYTLPLSTYDFYGTYSVDYGAIMAALVMTTIPVIVLYIFLQKQIINGVTAGAVKA